MAGVHGGPWGWVSLLGYLPGPWPFPVPSAAEDAALRALHGVIAFNANPACNNHANC